MSFQGRRCVERTAPGGSLFWRINTHAQAIVEILLLSCAAMKSVENMSIVEGIVLSHDHPSFRRACRINGHASDRLSRRCTHKRSRSCENPYRSTRFAPDAKAMIRLLSASSAPGAVRARCDRHQAQPKSSRVVRTSLRSTHPASTDTTLSRLMMRLATVGFMPRCPTTCRV